MTDDDDRLVPPAPPAPPLVTWWMVPFVVLGALGWVVFFRWPK